MEVHQAITPVQRFFATFFVGLGTLLITLDQFIANVSIPSISGELGVSQDQGAWVITSFTVANAIMVPLTGWMTTMIGRVRLFCLATILFAITSWLCGLSVSMPMLVFFRVLQGLASGGLIPLSQTLLMLIFPPEKKGVAIGFWGLVVMIGPAMGPVLGGWITDHYGWAWIFYVNVPIGFMAGIFTYFLLSRFESPRKKVPIDAIGLGLFVIGISSLQVMLDKGNDLDWWRSHFIVTLTITSIVSLSFFVVWELFHPTPVIDLSFFKSRNFTLGSITTSITMLFLFGSFILVPLWVQAQLGYTPLWAGYTLAPIGVFAIFLFPLVGLIIHYLDLRIWIAISFILFALTFFWFSSLNIDATFWQIAGPRFFQGIGFALFYIPLTTISIEGIPEHRMPSAAGLFSFIRILFISIGVTFSMTLWIRGQAFFQSRIVENVIPANPAYGEYLADLQSTIGIQGRTADAFLNEMVINQSYTLSLLDIFYLSAWSFIALLFLLFTFKTKKKEPLASIETPQIAE